MTSLSPVVGAIETLPSDDEVIKINPPVIVSGYAFTNSHLHYVQLNNTGSSAFSLDGWNLQFVSGAGTDSDVTHLSGVLAPGNYAVAADMAMVPGANYELIGANSFSETQRLQMLQLIPPENSAWLTQTIVPSSATAAGNWCDGSPAMVLTYFSQRERSTTTGNFNAGYCYLDTDPSVLYIDELLEPQPLNGCEDLRLSEIGANMEDQFIEVYNGSSESQQLLGCMLQTNRSSSASYVFGAQVLAPGAVVSVPIVGSGLTLTKTTAGTVYLLSSDGQVEVDVRSYENLSEGTSWSLVDGIWYQTFAVTPAAANIYQQYPPCEAGYERNLETGRCNKIAIATKPQPCRPDQYRNPETNRCRLIASATSSLTPCAANQYRNPTTNRCRLISSSASQLKPCAPGQERNPATNRCRKTIGSVLPAADFAVQKIKDGGQSTVGWLAFAGVGSLAVGYGVWEWRRELQAGISKLTGLFGRK